MGKTTIIEGISEVISGLNKVMSALQTTDVFEVKEGESVPMNAPVPKEKAKVKKSESSKDEAVSSNREDELRGMKYNEMKKLAASLGVSAAGKRDDIIARIIEAENNIDNEEEEDVEKKPAPKAKKKDKDSEPDEFDNLAKEVLEENGEEAVIEELKDHDIKATKKNVLELLAKALREGVIDLEEDNEEEDSEEDKEVDDDSNDEEGEDVTPDTYFSDYDEEGVNDPANSSKKRLKGMRKVMEEQIEAIENEDIDADDMKAYVQEMSTDEEKKEQSDWEDDDFVAAYLEAKKRMVDDDGDVHEPSEAYQIGNEYFCCGHQLVFDKKSKEYICPVCEQTYEA